MTKALTRIQELDTQKRKVHEEAYKKKYPEGTFSIQVFKHNKEVIIKLRWGTKAGKNPFSTQYWQQGFTVNDKGQITPGINNSFGTIYNFRTYLELTEKLEQINLKHNGGRTYPLFHLRKSYLWAYLRCTQ